MRKIWYFNNIVEVKEYPTDKDTLEVGDLVIFEEDEELYQFEGYKDKGKMGVVPVGSNLVTKEETIFW
jgi:hypothetical protein